MIPDLKHRLELIALSGVASTGAFWCSRGHFCNCGHLAHGSYQNIEPWIIDGAWLFALIGTAVVGIRGRFNGARPIGIVCSLLVVLIAISRSPLYGLDALVLFILLFVQIWELIRATLKNPNQAEQAAASNGDKRP